MEKRDALAAGWPVSYATRKIKTLALPAGNTVAFSDFYHFGSSRLATGRTVVTLWHDRVWLHLDICCHEPDPAVVADGNRDDGMGLWQGDLLEIFFGAIEPVPWQLQLAVGAGGGRFDSCGRYAAWSARVSRTPFGWQAGVRLPLAFLRLSDLGCGFNVCRQSVRRGELSSWSRLERAFHETENYGQLYLCSMAEVCFARFGQVLPAPLTRSAFERLLTRQSRPAHALAHGPWLSNPRADGMTVSWVTAGRVAAELEYRPAGSGRWRRLPAGLQHGVVSSHETMHVVHLTGLMPGREYEYRLLNWSSLQLTAQRLSAGGKPWRFRTLDPARREIAFAVCSDIHSNAGLLERLLRLPVVADTDFFVNLGDMLSLMSGPSAFFDGFLDVQARLYGASRPLLFVRGNHEQIGLFAADYFRVMPHPDGRSYYAFRHGPVCFVVLDAGNDHPDDVVHRNAALLAEERQWLAELATTPLYREARWRIAFLHMPPCRDSYDTEAALALTDGVFPAEAPLHLLLSGHVHRYFKMAAGSGVCLDCCGAVWRDGGPRLPFTVVANSNNTLLAVTATERSLEVRLLAADGQEQDRVRLERATR